MIDHPAEMSRKSDKIAHAIAAFQGRTFDAHFLGYFDHFNRQLFYEAHDVLEELWLPQRNGPDGAFYKGLIQLAGAFVHLQKDRLGPALALFKLARANLQLFPALHHGLDLKFILTLVARWIERLESPHLPPNPLASADERDLRLPAPT